MDGPLRTRGVWGCIRGSQRRSARPEEETPGKLRRPSQGQASQAYPSEVFDLKPTSTLLSFVIKIHKIREWQPSRNSLMGTSRWKWSASTVSTSTGEEQ